MKKVTEKKVTFSIVLTPMIYGYLKELSGRESRPLAQMARIIIEREMRKVYGTEN